MAPALASASAHTDSIKGLAQSIAKPAYRQLMGAEPALRRAVPVLIIAFLFTMAVGAALQVLDHRRQSIDAVRRRDRRRRRSSGRALRHTARREPALDVQARAQALLGRLSPTRATAGGREVYITDTNGRIVAATPAPAMAGTTLIDVLGPAQPLTTFAATAGVLETPLADGTAAFATVRTLKAPFGQMALRATPRRTRSRAGGRTPR